MAFETSSPETHAPEAAPPLHERPDRVSAEPGDEHRVIVLPAADPVPRGTVTSAEGELRVVWTPHSIESAADVLPLLPRRARPPWVLPDVLVLGDELPSYLRAEKGFHLLDAQGVRDLIASPPRGSRAPIVAIPDAFECDASLLADLRRLEESGHHVFPFSAVVRQRCRLDLLDSAPPQCRPARFGEAVRRGFDLVVAAAGVAVTVLLLPFVAAAVWLEDRGPVFYAQERIGRGGKTFKLLKFRSMHPDAESSGPAWATAEDARITRVGVFLRRSKIDELPQFINVLVGHMSLVGPRPERPFFVDILKTHVPHYDVRHTVRPGLTGWGTVKVGYGNSIEAKYLAHQFDLYHLTNRSLRFDLEIVARSGRFLFLPPEVADRYML